MSSNDDRKWPHGHFADAKDPGGRDEKAGQALDEMISGKGGSEHTASRSKPAHPVGSGEPVEPDEQGIEPEKEELEKTAAAALMLGASMKEPPLKLDDAEALLSEVFASREEADLDIDAEKAEDRAKELGKLVDLVISGQPLPREIDPSVRDLLMVCLAAHASINGRMLGEIPRRLLVDGALGSTARDEERPETGKETAGPSPASEGPAVVTLRRASRWAVWGGAVLAAAAAVAIVVVFRPKTPASRSPALARHTRAQALKRRSIRLARLLPGPFPKDQTASDRIEVIYNDGIRAHRGRLLRFTAASDDRLAQEMSGPSFFPGSRHERTRPISSDGPSREVRWLAAGDGLFCLGWMP